MLPYQHAVVSWIAEQAGLTGVVIFAAGLLSAFYGFRFLRFLLMIACAGLGYVGGWLLTEHVGQPPLVCGAAGAIAAGLLGLAWPTPAVALGSSGTWALLAAYIGSQVGLKGPALWIGVGLLGGIGLLMTLVCRRAMTLLLTSLHGAAWMIIGFVGAACAFMPAVGATFKSWASGPSYVVPILLLMLVATGYSCQANARQGDIRSGVQDGVRVAPPRTAARPG